MLERHAAPQKKFSELQWFRFDVKIGSFVYQNFEKNQSLLFSPQKFCKFLSNSVHFLDSHSKYAQNDSFTNIIFIFEKVRKFENIWIIPLPPHLLWLNFISKTLTLWSLSCFVSTDLKYIPCNSQNNTGASHCFKVISYTPLVMFLYTPYSKHITKWLFWNC